jgi:hypothetical protein
MLALISFAKETKTVLDPPFEMNIDISLNRLLTFACPSVRYRIRKELLCQPPELPGMINVQKQILQDEAVREVIESQGSDGWLAWSFHGYNSMESGIRLLCEKGVEANQPVLERALDSLEKHTNRLERGLGEVGKILDDLGFGGSQTIRAYLFAHAGKEEIPLVKKQIEQTLEVFKFVCTVESLESLYQPYKDKLVFRKGIRWPSIYHLRLLSLTKNWRTPKNYKMILESIRQIVRLSPIPHIYVRYKSQLIAPASFCMDNFHADLNRLTDAEWMQWFHRMELLSRLGVANQIPQLKQQIQALADMLQAGHGSFVKKLNHIYFKKWGAYTGLMLEKDWRHPQRRINDLTFRSLLICAGESSTMGTTFLLSQASR